MNDELTFNNILQISSEINTTDKSPEGGLFSLRY